MPDGGGKAIGERNGLKKEQNGPEGTKRSESEVEERSANGESQEAGRSGKAKK
ncbi:MAG: hypothetical protein MJ087_02265 [Lachnospiraceae bacterium]|nr:hypothetical protein [Lachnospiraceae bacterium]